MQIAESKVNSSISYQANPAGRKCTVCEHPDLKAIEALLADVSISQRGIAKQFGLSHISLYRHAKTHLAAKVKAAVARRQEKDADVFMERHEHLYAESLQYIQDAKGAVKMQRVTVDTEEGPQERYQAFRDVGAMAPAITAATQLQRVLGDATARFVQAGGAGGAVNVNLQIVIPRAIDASQLEQLPAIDVQAIEPDSEPGE
mgnify:CR=1 FL=1